TVPRGTTVVLEMTGKNFSNKAGAPVIIIGDRITPLDVTYVNPEAITARVSIDDSAPLGLQSMQVFNQDKQFGVQQRYKLRVVSDLAELEAAVTGGSTDGSKTLKGTGKAEPLADDYANTKAEATRLETSLSGRLEVSGDTDLFRIDLAQNGSLSISSAGPTDLVGELRDAEGKLIGADDDGGARYNFQLDAPLDAGTYYLRVRHCCNGKGSYSLNQTFQP
ncbi:MAG: PPC domain-containing protein, partial [Alphaproteobacteria bacterium]